ncbi:MAG TPA: VOC family protein [Acidimicrobiales bacterium]|nr:VOC family protein [Acidimicrobiales bacterium]
MKITKFHHVSVNTQDAPLSDMVSFYDDLFGLDSKDRPDIPGVPGHWFHVADQELHVVGAAPRGTAIDSTGNHYCVAVEDLDKAILELEERKIPYQQAVQGAGTIQIWINDPAGNTIELQQDKTTAPRAASSGDPAS